MNVQGQTSPEQQTVPDSNVPAQQAVPAPEQRYQVAPVPQPVPAPQTPVVDEQTESRIKAFQSQAEKNRIEAERNRQIAEQSAREAELLRQQLLQLQYQQPQYQAPIDPYSPEGQEYQRQQELARMRQEILQQTQQIVQQQNQQFIQGLAEQSFIQKNPNVDLGTLKSFMQANGIASWNLEAGYKLMNPTPAFQQQPIPIQSQFQQPQVQNIGAIRAGAGSVNQPIQVSFEKALADYRANPAVETTWSPEFKNLFWSHVQNAK